MYYIALIDNVVVGKDINDNDIKALKVVRIVEINNIDSLEDIRKFMNFPYAIVVNNTVKEGMYYDINTNSIRDNLGNKVYPPITPDETLMILDKKVRELTYTKDLNELKLEEIRDYLIRKNKMYLEKYLENHPMKYNDKYYTVTSSKQNQLTELLNAYKFAKDINVDLDLSWNETGKEFEPYTYEDLIHIYLAMLDYVKPIVTFQQKTETRIKATQDKESAININITFSDYN